jgi:protocatechuate 3,4-dioxygenase beta subunit
MNALIPIEEAQTHTTRLDLPAVVLKLASLKLAGQVLGTDGQPAIGARVSFSGAGQANTNTESDATGHFAFDVCEGAVTIVANMDGVTGRAQAAGGDTNVVLQIGRNAAIATTALPNNGVVGRGPVTTTGTVFDPSGAPAPGVDLSVMPRTSLMQDVKSEADGRFSITWQPQNFGPAAVTRTTGNAFEYLLVGRDLAHNYASTARIDEKTTNLDMRLREGLALSSSVRDINGAPVKTATVRLIMNALGWTRPLDRPLASVDEQGVFTLSALPQGQAFSLTATAPGFGIVTVPVTATETQTARLQLPPIKLAMVNRPLEGVVVGSNNQPVPGATVRVGGEGQPTVTAVTDANGRFALKVCEGTVGVSASVPRNLYGQASSATVQARAGDVNVVLKLAVPGAAPAAPAPAPDDLR